MASLKGRNICSMLLTSCLAIIFVLLILYNYVKSDGSRHVLSIVGMRSAFKRLKSSLKFPQLVSQDFYESWYSSFNLFKAIFFSHRIFLIVSEHFNKLFPLFQKVN